MNQKFSVLISVYYKVDVSQFMESMISVFNQSLVPNEVVLIEDGPLTNSLYQAIEELKTKYKSLKVVTLEKNMGLGYALAKGITHCEYNYIARMDTDDISRYDRFEKQVNFLNANKEISVVGGQISEFYINKDNPINYRVVPTKNSDIKNMLKRRNPMNHVSVMFRKDDILKIGNYIPLDYLEDYYLWARLIANNKILHNIEDILVDVRTGEDMYARRGNRKYIKAWFVLQNYMYSKLLINKIDCFINKLNIIVFINTPPKIKGLIYKKFLRKNEVGE